jgi:alpha-glucosidase
MTRFATVARRDGENWFIGSLNGPEPRRVNIALNFLMPGINYTAQIYADDASLNSGTNVRQETKIVQQSTVLQFDVGSGHGIAIRLTPISGKR